jgi:hypothetical protein
MGCNCTEDGDNNGINQKMGREILDRTNDKSNTEKKDGRYVIKEEKRCQCGELITKVITERQKKKRDTKKTRYQKNCAFPLNTLSMEYLLPCFEINLLKLVMH